VRVFVCVCLCVHVLAVVGILKGYDPLVNIVLDDTQEFLRGAFTHADCCLSSDYGLVLRACLTVIRVVRTATDYADPEDPYKLTGETRTLGLTMCRGALLWLLVQMCISQHSFMYNQTHIINGSLSVFCFTRVLCPIYGRVPRASTLRNVV
jgi:small nuclear ribonucleoprotein (snRNP)-like protein